MMEGWCFDCALRGGVRDVRGGAFCGDVVLLITERWCFLLRGSARKPAPPLHH